MAAWLIENIDVSTVLTGLTTLVVITSARWFTKRASLFFDEHTRLTQAVLTSRPVPQIDGSVKYLALLDLLVQITTENHRIIRWQSNHDERWPETPTHIGGL